jgi:SecD/SecF fusion protein
MSQNYSGRLALIVSIVLVALFAIFYPSVAAPKKVAFNPNVPFLEKTSLKPGIDIVGGTSLLYEIKQPEGRPISNLAEEVMKALKKRVDPNGTLNLIWRPQGTNRLEIQMPLSSASGDAAQRRKAVEDARAALERTNVNVAEATDALEGKNGRTRAEFDKLLANAPAGRKQILTELAAAWDDLQKARAAHDVEAGAKAQDRYEQLQNTLAQTNLSPDELTRTLALKGSREAKLNQLKDRWKNDPERLAAINAYQQASDALASGKGLDSASDLKRLLQGSGVLEFHILAVPPSRSQQPTISQAEYQQWVERLQKDGPRVQANDEYRWFEVDNPDEFKGSAEQYNDRDYVLASIRPEDSLDQRTGKWALTSARPVTDPQSGQNEVGFAFDTFGANKFGDLTTRHVHKPMAIMLDGRVISAPNINGPITGGNGVITGGGDGGFGQKDLDYLVRTLSAGSLPAQLNSEPISERTVGPQLGEDNLHKGLFACGLGLVVVAVFLIGYYHLSGVIAFFAIILNIILILGCMAAINATFTLPGIAAIVLTIGTAVDANVLVFERLREEQHRGLSIRMAVRNAYDRAFSAIFDSNMTTVITCFFLIMFGTEEVKGFGITLIIGILASLFTALFVTRTVFGILIDRGHLKRLGSLPLSYPRWERLLHPKIDWVRLAPYFYTFSIIMVVSGLGLFVHYAMAGQVLDIEFASGTAVTFELKQPQKQETVRSWLDEASRSHPTVLPAPSVVRVGEGGTTWEVTTANPESRAVRDLILATLGKATGGKDVLKVEQPSTFQHVGEKVDQVLGTESVVLPLTADNLAPDAAAKWPNHVIPEEARRYAGGAAIVLRDLNPPLSPKEITDRVNRQVLQVQTGGQQQAATPPNFTVVGAGGPEKPVTTAVILTGDESLPVEKDRSKWADGVVAPIWTLVNDAVARPPDLQQVKTFDKSVAGDTQRDALVALVLSVLVIMAYIWIRFGNLKYGTATVVALLHDVLFTIAGLGFAHLLANHAIGEVLQLEPFRINLTVVAGILTIMGYSMIDTIVVFDRVREIRGKYGHVSRQVLNDAINQTLSRTLLTAGTTTIMVAIMYFFGGSGIHGFTFVLFVGILVGTYSSVAIAAPILLLGHEGAPETAAGGRQRTVGGKLQRAGA